MVLAAIRGDTSYGSRWQDRCGGRLESSEAKAEAKAEAETETDRDGNEYRNRVDRLVAIEQVLLVRMTKS